MSRISSVADWVLRLPLLWGGLACLAFYALINSGQLDHPLVDRYFNSHVVEQITTAMFFVGAAALAIRFGAVLGQLGVARRSLLEPIPPAGQPVADAGMLIARLADLPEYLQKTYLVRRLYDAVDWVRRRDAVDGLDEELLRLEQKDWDRMASGYSLVRIIAWAMPMLGFLGTVIGITLAIANLNMEALLEGTDDVTSGLGVAFDTTALALALTIVLMLAKFGVEHVEQHLLAEVGVRCRAELVGRFQQVGASSDPNVASIHRMCDQVVRSVEVMSARQADLWKGTIDETNSHWKTVIAQSGDEFGESLTAGLREGLRGHAEGLTSGVAEQLATLNQSVTGQLRGLEGAAMDASQQLTRALLDQVEAFAASSAAHAEQLAEGGQKHAEQLVESGRRHAEQLAEGAERHVGALRSDSGELVANLRSGLERMAELLVEALQKHGDALTTAEQELASENRRHLSEVEAALGEAMVLAADRQEKLIGRSEQLLGEMRSSLTGATDATLAQHEQLVKQGEVLLKIVDSTGQVRQLEEALAQNLSTLGRTHNFEETLLSLSAAIQLLSARVGRGPAPEAANESTPPTSHAA